MLQLNPNKQHKAFEMDHKEITNRNGGGTLLAAGTFDFMIPWAGFSNGALYLEFAAAGAATFNISHRPVPASGTIVAAPSAFPATLPTANWIEQVFPTNLSINGTNTIILNLCWDRTGTINYSAHQYVANAAANTTVLVSASSVIQPWLIPAATIRWSINTTGANAVTLFNSRAYLTT